MEIPESLQTILQEYPEAKEILEKLSNRYWRLNNLYSIKDKKGNKIPFHFNWAQELLFNSLWFLSVVLKVRQLGITTFFCVLYLDDTLFSRNKTSAIIAHKLTDAQKIFREKIKFAWDNLPDWLKDQYEVNTDTKNELVFSLKGSGGKDASSISVSTSVRSGTVQNLHISELGYICRHYPEKAEEIKTGALNAVAAGQMISIESTADGREGDFFDICMRSLQSQKLGRSLSKLDFKFFFFPWWKHPEYILDDQVIITKELQTYFDELQLKIAQELTLPQRYWYAAKHRTLEEKMFSEYPSTVEEAFMASIEGAYYSTQMNRVLMEKRITTVPWVPTVPVDTWWDLGMDDYTVILFVQRVGREIRFINTLYGSGEGLEFYAAELKKLPYIYGRHIFPHDVEVRELGTGKTRKEIAQKLGIMPIVVAPKLSPDDGIAAARVIFPQCYFDEQKCARLITDLQLYRKKWDEKLGVFRSDALHDEHSHGADAFRYGATVVREGFSYSGSPGAEIVPQDEGFDSYLVLPST
jgi:hypothetical protein